MRQNTVSSNGVFRIIPLLVFIVLSIVLATVALLSCSSPSRAVTSASPQNELMQIVTDASSQSESMQVVSDTPYSKDSKNDVSSSAVTTGNELMSRVAADIHTLASQSGMQTSVAVIDLSSGVHAGYQADDRMVSASMIKLVIAAAFLEQVKAGQLSLNSLYTLQPSDIVGGTGTLSGYGVGAQVTYEEILNKMISVSDNTGANILIDAVGMDAINAEAQKLELTATQLNRRMMDSDAIAAGIENYTSANDVATLLAKVYNGTFVDSSSSAIMMQALEEQQDSGGIMGGLPYGTVFAHKTGSLGSVRHDGGIVEASRPFVLVVMCGGDGFYEQGAHNVMASVAEVVYSDIVS